MKISFEFEIFETNITKRLELY